MLYRLIGAYGRGGVMLKHNRGGVMLKHNLRAAINPTHRGSRHAGLSTIFR